MRSLSQERSNMARVVQGSYSFTCISTRLSTNEMDHARLCLPSQAGLHLATLVGWKAELTWTPQRWVNSLSAARKCSGQDSGVEPLLNMTYWVVRSTITTTPPDAVLQSVPHMPVEYGWFTNLGERNGRYTSIVQYTHISADIERCGIISLWVGGDVQCE